MNESERKMWLAKKIYNSPVPPDRFAEEREKQRQIEATVEQYSTPEALAELEAQIQRAKTDLEEWKTHNEVLVEFFAAIQKSKEAIIFPEDELEVQAAKNRIAEIEDTLGITSADLAIMYYSVADLAQRGYTPAQIAVLHALDRGKMAQVELVNLQGIKKLVEKHS